jgi:subtilase family serine protease
VTPLLDSGFTGKGQSIVIIDSFGSPTIRHDLQVFDQGYGLPDPPSFKILAPLGTVPFNPKKIPDQIGWAFETTLDVEWSHAIAPEANIVLMTSPVDETEGVMGLPQFLFLEKYALDHHLGKIISQSWGATEETLFTPAGRQVIQNFEQFYERARNENVTVFASSGDFGSTDPELNGTTLYPFPVIAFPASSPLVTAVGGTSLFATTSGNYQNEIVWNNNTGASGGGISKIFNEPDYQQTNLPAADQNLLNGHRGMPDVAYNADPNTSILVYISIPVPGIPPGFYMIGGTSEGSPQWAGIIADANQLAGRPLGFLNSAIYSIGNSGDYQESFHDITFGSNAFAGVRGFKATPGWDLSTGWGSPKVATLVTELIERIQG